MAFIKNTSGQYVYFTLVDSSDGSPLTGATVSAYVSKDGGAQASGSGTVTEDGNGQYHYAPTQSETDADEIGFLFTASGAVPASITVATEGATVESRSAFDASADTVNVGQLAGSTVQQTGGHIHAYDDAGNALAVASVQPANQPTVDASGHTEAIDTDGTDFNDLAQSDILSDGTPFPGANIDAAISTRSSHDDPDPNGYISNLSGHVAQSGDTYAVLPTNFSDLAISAGDGYVRATDTDGDGLSSSMTQGVAQGGTGTTIQLEASASDQNQIYRDEVVRLVGGTGEGQGRLITDYQGGDKTATVDEAWVTNPDSTSEYEIDAGRVALARETHSGAIIETVLDVTNRVTANTDQIDGSSVQSTSGEVHVRDSDGNVLNNISVSDIFGHTGFTASGTVDLSEVLQKVFAEARGRIVDNGDGTYDYYDDDDTTILFTLDLSDTERTNV